MGFLTFNLKMVAHHAVKRSALFHRSMADIIRFRHLPPEDQRGDQLRLLERTLRMAAYVPHYAALAGMEIDTDNPIEQLKALPYVEKEQVRRSPGSFRTSVFSIGAHTSGTTGTPLRLRRSLNCIAREAAGFFAWHQACGWHAGEPLVVLRGDLVVPVDRVQPPFGVRDMAGNRLVLSSYHLSDANADWYLEAIRSSGARFLDAYPSSAYVLADVMRRHAERPLGLAGVFLASETVFDGQKTVIEQWIGPVHAQYGTAERVCWMTTCSAGCYHEDPQYGYTEYVPLGDGTFEIVATGFTNHAMPLLRYRTGDLAFAPFGWDYRCSCGMPGPGCAQIIGRTDDLFITASGRKIGRLDHVFKGIQHVIAAQIVQHEPGEAEVRIMRDAHYCPRDEEMIVERFRARVGTDVVVRCTYLGHLPRTASGKFHAVVSYCAHHKEE